LAWPEDPYKGLVYYKREDIPLFAGRSTDVTRVANILGGGKTRMLLLHGNTGCGKSSFLRAGLIPFLENQTGRFNFAKESEGSPTALFIRSTYNPLLELASRAYEAAGVLQTEENKTSLNQAETAASLSEDESVDYAFGPIIDREKFPTVAAFTGAVLDNPEQLVETIGRIAYRRPRTQALVVDQAEEVLTLRPGTEGEAFRRQFFKFLAYLSRSSINFRLIVAFRTEYHGRFYASLRASRIDASCVEDYYLGELTARDMTEAIKRPCSDEEIPGYGVPREHYRFTFEEGLPERIAEDLSKTPLTSGTLPVLQIVCRRLYQDAKSAPQSRSLWVIRQQAYDDLGGIQGQIDLHLQQALQRCCENRLRLFELKFEIMRWRDVLSELVKPQADGSVTTDVKPAKILFETAETQGCRMPFDSVMTFLEKDEWRIVRSAEVRELNTNAKIPCYSLGHDALGGVLERWRLGRHKDRLGIRKTLYSYGVVLILGSFFAAPFLAKIVGNTASVVRNALIGAGFAFCLLAAIPDRKGFRLVYRSVHGFLTNLSALPRLYGASSAERDLVRTVATRHF
jgi:energy-coupling factor transporter ATP-binding protein EcfA2